MEQKTRIFPVTDYIRLSDDAPIRSVVLETTEAVIVVWYVQPGQVIDAHVHPQGQDTWTILSGEADYFQGDGDIQRIKANDIVIARVNQIHGAKTVGDEPLLFVSVVAPGDAGYALASE